VLAHNGRYVSEWDLETGEMCRLFGSLPVETIGTTYDPNGDRVCVRGSPLHALDRKTGEKTEVPEALAKYFRRAYAATLSSWLGLPVRAALGGAFDRPLFRDRSQRLRPARAFVPPSLPFDAVERTFRRLFWRQPMPDERAPEWDRIGQREAIVAGLLVRRSRRPRHSQFLVLNEVTRVAFWPASGVGLPYRGGLMHEGKLKSDRDLCDESQ
jgi:hypothetical protein